MFILNGDGSKGCWCCCFISLYTGISNELEMDKAFEEVDEAEEAEEPEEPTKKAGDVPYTGVECESGGRRQGEGVESEVGVHEALRTAGFVFVNTGRGAV